MKRNLLTLFLILVCALAYSQNLKPEVIATSGEFYVNNNNSVSWTIGECIPETFSNGNNKLTQGYQQGIYDIGTVIDNTENLIKINLFPNPATDYVSLEIQFQGDEGYFYQLFDSNGKCLKNGKITSTRSEIRMSGFSDSAYFLKVFAPDQKLLKLFKILKIN